MYVCVCVYITFPDPGCGHHCLRVVCCFAVPWLLHLRIDEEPNGALWLPNLGVPVKCVYRGSVGVYEAYIGFRD